MGSSLISKLCGVAAVAALALPVAALQAMQEKPSAAESRILLVGNSILYTGNVPITLTRVASHAGSSLDVAMYAQPGAKVSDIVQDTNVMSLLRYGRYDTVVFHDQGGNSICMAERQLSGSCEKVLADHRAIVKAIRAGGGTPYLLGTYQKSAEASRSIEQAEARIAKDLGVVHIPVSEKWREGMRVLPDSRWLADDGIHPGPILTVMMAMEIYQAVTGKCPPLASIESPASGGIPLDERDGKLYLARDHAASKGAGASAEEVRTLIVALNPKCLGQGK